MPSPISFCSLVMPQPFPIGGAILTFTLGFLIARLAKDRGWRVIHILLLHLGGFSLIVLSLISRLDLLRPTGGREQFALGLVVLVVPPVLAGGRGPCPARVFPSGRLLPIRCGIGAFVLFFLLGIGIEQPQLAGYLSVFSFFFFSILALALAWDQGGDAGNISSATKG